MKIIKNWDNERYKYNRLKREKKEYVLNITEPRKGIVILQYKNYLVKSKTKNVQERLSRIIDDLLRGDSQNSTINKISKEKKWNIEQIKEQIKISIEYSE